MTASRSPEVAIALLARETRVKHSKVRRSLGGFAVEPGFRCVADGCYRQRCDSGLQTARYVNYIRGRD